MGTHRFGCGRWVYGLQAEYRPNRDCPPLGLSSGSAYVPMGRHRLWVEPLLARDRLLGSCAMVSVDSGRSVMNAWAGSGRDRCSAITADSGLRGIRCRAGSERAAPLGPGLRVATESSRRLHLAQARLSHNGSRTQKVREVRLLRAFSHPLPGRAARGSKPTRETRLVYRCCSAKPDAEAAPGQAESWV
jgi:hypothetical protein